MTVTYMTDGYPKSWDKKLRTYEITYPLGEKVIWKNITARDVYNILKPEFVEEIIKAEMLEIMEIAEDKKLRKAARLIYNYHSLWAEQI